MTNERYDAFMSKLDALMKEPNLESLQLSEQEQVLINNLPPELSKIIEDQLTLYTPAGEVDIRRNLINKLVASILIDLFRNTGTAIELGYMMGEEV